MSQSPEEFQKKYFKEPFIENYKWRTTNRYIKQQECNLLTDLSLCIKRLPPNAKILEVACGEGPNISLLETLQVQQTIIGLDFVFERVAFCQRTLLNMRGVTASAAELPFKDESFELVFFRDLLHHTADIQNDVLMECLRVLEKGKMLYFMEANGHNPCFFIQAIALKPERGLLQSNKKNINALASRFGESEIVMHGPSNFFRILFHYSVGFPALANVKIFTMICNVWGWIAEKIMPKTMWSYILVKIVKS